MDDSTNVFFDKDDSQSDAVDRKSAAKRGKADDSEFYDDMPREIVEYLIKTHPLSGENVKSRRRNLDENRTGSRTRQESKSRLTNYDSKASSKDFDYDSDEMEQFETDGYSYLDEDETIEKTTVKKQSANPIISTRIIVLLIIVLVILVMLFLVIRNSQLKKQLAEKEVLVTQAEGIKALNDRLSDKIDELSEEIADLKGNTANVTVNDIPDQTSPSNPSSDTSQTEDSPEVSQNTEKTYTVKSGDNLSKISKEVYGNAGLYQKIIDYNNLTSDVLSVGTVLKIPPLE